jgi:rhodanese-related sulfurtransferase
VREVRELEETGFVPGAINIPITTNPDSFHISEDEFEYRLGYTRPGKDKQLMIYCRAGVRAHGAAELAKAAGWTVVGEYPGSWLDWEKQGGPVTKVERGKPAPPKTVA